MFWSDYPWWNHFTLYPQTRSFHSYPFEHDPIPLPSPDMVYQHITYPPDTSLPSLLSSPLPSLLSSICSFLYTYFAKRPHLLFTPHTLLSHHDHIFVMLHHNTVIGTIRYHYIGNLWTENHPSIYLVDAFCIHPSYRKKGIGSYLLAKLHRYANEYDQPHAIFLKEGPILPILPLPLYSGCYVYRHLSPLPSFPSSPSSPYVLSLTTEQAYRWIAVYMKCQPNTLVITNPSTANQCWKAYRKGTQSILVCIQDTHQVFCVGQKIGWVTVWLESPNVTDSVRRTASFVLSDAVSDMYQWIWMNRKWIGDTHLDESSVWKEDGGFHWYTYQFSTGLSMNQSYGIMA